MEYFHKSGYLFQVLGIAYSHSALKSHEVNSRSLNTSETVKIHYVCLQPLVAVSSHVQCVADCLDSFMYQCGSWRKIGDCICLGVFFWPVTVTVKQSQPCATCMCLISRMTGAYCTHISRIDLLSATGLHSASIFLLMLLLGTHSTCEFALSYMPVAKKYLRKNSAISREYCYGDIPRQFQGPFFLVLWYCAIRRCDD